MVTIRKYMLKAAGFKVRVEGKVLKILKGEETITEIVKEGDSEIVVKHNGKELFRCEHVIVNVAKGRLFLLARTGIEGKHPYIEYYLWL